MMKRLMNIYTNEFYFRIYILENAIIMDFLNGYNRRLLQRFLHNFKIIFYEMLIWCKSTLTNMRPATTSQLKQFFRKQHLQNRVPQLHLWTLKTPIFYKYIFVKNI